ncbi:hypothetical protein FVE85_9287 [Porphyridium purpureum]|uniref:Uncharacterized protein n=1 Tax=Porphyridium purpureum TaxID=35688 RepID=A0A5J4YP90_PORPP|nr:hypothetical protein FVE85_9287 [Porphyridium purpureum]|eukprot:POR4093..scf222_8
MHNIIDALPSFSQAKRGIGQSGNELRGLYLLTAECSHTSAAGTGRHRSARTVHPHDVAGVSRNQHNQTEGRLLPVFTTPGEAIAWSTKVHRLARRLAESE